MALHSLVRGVFNCLFPVFVAQVSFAVPTNWDGQPGSLGFKAIRDGDQIWMDLTVSRGMSYNDVVAEIGPGLTFVGWRVATAEEASGLLSAAGVNGGSDSSPYRQQVIDLMSIWGGPFYSEPNPRHNGADGPLHLVDFVLADVYPSDPPARRVAGAIGYDDQYSFRNCCSLNGANYREDTNAIGAGVALIRLIPEPSSLLLAMFAVSMGLLQRGKRFLNSDSCRKVRFSN